MTFIIYKDIVFIETDTRVTARTIMCTSPIDGIRLKCALEKYGMHTVFKRVGNTSNAEKIYYIYITGGHMLDYDNVVKVNIDSSKK